MTNNLSVVQDTMNGYGIKYLLKSSHLLLICLGKHDYTCFENNYDIYNNYLFTYLIHSTLLEPSCEQEPY